MAVSDVQAPPGSTSDSPLPRRRARWRTWSSGAVGGIAVLAVGVPMLATAAIIAFQRPDVVLDGDAAVDELALMRAVHLAQLVGNYSRYGWNHPGPAWFYALVPAYASTGGHSWSFYVAVLVFHGVLAGLVVAAAWRGGGWLLALVSSALVLLYVRALGEDVFRAIWPPYALMFPAVMFFIMAAAGAAGSTPAVVGALVAGSFLAQTHVSTAPLVLALLVTMAAVRLVPVLLAPRSLAAGASRWAGGRATRSIASSLATAGGTALLVLMWVPVAIDNFTGRPGNLTSLWQFFTVQHDRHPYHEALSAFTRMLEVYPFGHLPYFLESDFSNLPPQRWLLAAAFLAGAAGLAGLGAILRDRLAGALGLLLLVAALVTIVSISRVVGPMYPYLVTWVTTFPMILALGWAALLVRTLPRATWWRPLPGMARGGLTAGLGVAVVVLAVGRLAAFQLFIPYVTMTADPDTRPAWAMTQSALAAEPTQPIVVDIAQGDRWVAASGVAVELAKHGWRVTVTDPFVFMFGDDARSTGRERLELVIVGRSELDAVQSRTPDLQPIGHHGETYLFLERRS